MNYQLQRLKFKLFSTNKKFEIIEKTNVENFINQKANW